MAHGYTLGRVVVEVTMGSDHVVIAARDLYGPAGMRGSALLPAAHGTKEMLIRCTETHLAPAKDARLFLRRFAAPGENYRDGQGIDQARPKPRNSVYLRMCDATLVLNRDWLIGWKPRAKGQGKWSSRVTGRRPQAHRHPGRLAKSGLAMLNMILHQMRVAGQISEHDQKKLARSSPMFCAAVI